jgi:Lipocalin-like domain
MKLLHYGALTIVLALTELSGLSHAQSTNRKDADTGSAKETLIGAWRLAWMEEPGADGKLRHITDRKGMLIYTRDGHMSVQVMYPKSEAAQSNDYVQGGYEASFGSYDVNEEAHTVTHHVEGSLTRQLIGKDLPRMYRFSDGRLTLRSSRSDEHWSVTWEHY